VSQKLVMRWRWRWRVCSRTAESWADAAGAESRLYTCSGCGEVLERSRRLAQSGRNIQAQRKMGTQRERETRLEEQLPARERCSGVGALP